MRKFILVAAAILGTVAIAPLASPAQSYAKRQLWLVAALRKEDISGI